MDRTVGVEEELFLVDARTRVAAPRSAGVLRQAVEQVGEDAQGLDRELFRHMLETRTRPTASMEDLRRQLVAARRLAAEAAEATGSAVLASGTLPTAYDLEVTSDDRYRDIVERFAEVARHGGTCGMHVHVQVDSPDLGVRVIDRTMPWMPVVLALSANSPFHQGHDTSYASWRAQMWAQWPSAGPTERFGSLETYRDVCRQLVESGAARDTHMAYFDARLSEAYPTVEFRISDVCTDPDDAVLVAALLRGLVVASLATEERDLDEGVVWRTELLRAARWRAARHGVADRLLDPLTGRLQPAAQVLGGLVDVVREPLEEAGDLDLVRQGVARVLAGGGASRQRAARERGADLAGVVDDLVERTHRSWHGHDSW